MLLKDLYPLRRCYSSSGVGRVCCAAVGHENIPHAVGWCIVDGRVRGSRYGGGCLWMLVDACGCLDLLSINTVICRIGTITCTSIPHITTFTPPLGRRALSTPRCS